MEIQKPRQWILQNKPQGLPVLDRGHKGTFALVTATLPQLGENQVLVKPVYLSNDPAQQVWMSMSTADYHPERAYAPPIEVGDPIASFAIAEVVESQCARLSPGSLVYGRVSWSDLAIIDEKDCFFTLESPTEEGLSITQRMGSLGLSGLTAYYGLYDIVNATANDSIVISGAAGAVGIMAVQIAKRIIECKYVSGMATPILSFFLNVCLGYWYSWNRREMPLCGKSRRRCMPKLSQFLV
jgi:NADPH-dependent curcumin reductase CurA